MSLVSVVVILIVIGILLYVVNAHIPMDANIKKILNAVVIVVVVLWLLSVFGILPDINLIRVGR